MNSEVAAAGHCSNCYQWPRKPEEGAEAAQTGGRASPEAGGARCSVGEARRCLEQAGEGCRPARRSNRRSTRRHGDLKPPESSWDSSGPRAMSGSTFCCRSDVSSCWSRRRRRSGNSNDSAEEGRKLKTKGWKSTRGEKLD